MIDYGRELNAEQMDVVMQSGGPLLVIAGAGSGKTRTLTYRVARLIESGVRPGSIMLATFTNKAARSMLTRVNSLVGMDVALLWGGTFHHIAHRILRENSHRIGYERNFSIIDSEDARQLLNTSVAESGIDTKGEKFPKADVLGGMISLALNTETGLEDVVLSRFQYFSHRIEDIQLAASVYRERKKSLNMMDFDDLLINCRTVLKDFPDVAAYYADKFRHLLVDEYQDTNIIQADIVDLIASRSRNLMVVGDDSQSIYSFRGAHFANIMKFPEKYPDCRIFKLETNYRSTPEILHLANQSIINNERQFQKSLKAVRDRGIKPVLVSAGSVGQQADFVAQRIIELNRGGIPLNEIAVLYRAHYHSMEVQMEMTRRGIPFEIRSGIRFFEQAHIKDITSYMRIVLNPFDELAWKRILKLYDRVGNVAAEKIWSFIAKQNSPFESIQSEAFLKSAAKTAAPSLIKIQKLFRELAEYSADSMPGSIIGLVVEKDYNDRLQEKYTDSVSRLDDIRQLITFAGEFDTLNDFLNELALMTNMTENGDVRQDKADEDKVVLSTIHQAKGLEWQVVFLIWCSEGMMPLARALKEADGEEEERRLFYVATTRAKDHLYLSYPLTDYTRGMGHLPISPSRFIRELTPSVLGRQNRPYDEWMVDSDE